ncbi:hypothetical protein EBR37_04030, partial [bacterium]|nr:hypothetical protein [bacterium]
MLKFFEQSKLGSAQKQIDIENINEGVIKISKEEYRLVLKTGSINFELKNEQEQDAIIDIYENFLNGLNFPIQILIRTRELNIKEYLEEFVVHLEDLKLKRLVKDEKDLNNELAYLEAKLKFLIYMSQTRRKNEEISQFLTQFPREIASRLSSIQL